MTFTPPSIDKLVENTGNLYKQCSELFNLYPITKSEEEEQATSEKQTNLKWWFARIQVVIDSNTGRTTAHDVFKKLVNKLENVNAEDRVQSRKAISFLIGALLHRYFRILQECDDYNAYLRFAWWYKYPGGSKLFKDIRVALKFPKVADTEVASLTTEEFKCKDIRNKDNLTGMDEASIVIHLETFRKNMLLEEKGEPEYKKYEHLRQDPNFKKHLDEIIAFYKVCAAPVLKQLRAVFFIESLTIDVIAKGNTQMNILGEWHKILAKEYPNFATLNLETIEAHVRTHVTDEVGKEKLLDLLSTKRIKQAFEHFNHESFFSTMKKAITDSAVYTIVGGYCLLLRSEGLDKIRFNLYKALGIARTPEELTAKNMSTYLGFLDNYISSNPKSELNYDFFDGKEKMGLALDQTIEKLMEEQQEPQPESNLVVLV